MKKIMVLAAAAALTAGVSALAANPFSDVSTDDWAYQAVSDLSDQGVVEGYPDGTFKGERNITRYELAQIIARLMAKEDQLNAEQRATLDKLAGEYADELANLGVRVSNLEKKVGNISWSGDAKMWYVNNSKKTRGDSWKGRMRIKVRGQVNDSTYVQGRFKNQMDFKGDNSSDTIMDWLYVNHTFGDANVTLGRMPVTIYDGFMFDSTLKGAKLAYGKDAFDVSLSFGRLVDNEWLYDSSTFDAVLAEAGYDFGAAKLRAAYVKLPGDKGKETAHFDNMWSTHLSIPVKDFQIFGEYWDSNAKKADKSWQAGLGYNNFSMKKPGSFDLNLAYNKVGYNANLDGTTYDTGEIWNGIAKDKTLTYWSIFGDVALMKNVSLHGEYAFDLDNQKDGFDDKAWTLALNYKY
ncbi:S-layer homology domain-containing protein [Dialister succinatiphilus]|uniref:S-layer homology domain-containing protein n=1 Tax=Dialister succinatiphilus TaxID=487173 RepID=UPI002352AB2C|nr:S-layer homology domain-containing protein [Dialister succinatiphilus]